MTEPTFNSQLSFSNAPDNTQVDMSNTYNPAQDSVLNNINDTYKAIVSKFEHNYELLKFIPTPNVVDSRPVGCAVPAEGTNTSPVTMSQLDNNLHTVDSCKLAASLQFADLKYLEKLNGPTSSSTKGLRFTVYDGYFNDDVTYPSRRQPSKSESGNNDITGIATDFSDIYKSTTNTTSGATQYNRPRVDQHNYTVEWKGIIIPDETGNWTFSTNSDDASFLWIGDSAATPSIANALVNNRSPHGMRTVTNSIYLNKDTQYQFRMQFGEAGGGYNNILSVTPPTTSKGNRYYGVLYVNSAASLKQMYYSLQESSQSNTAKGLFNCYVTDPNNDTTVGEVANINNTITSGYYNATDYGILWQGLSTTTTPSQVPTSGIITAQMTTAGFFNIVSGTTATSTLVRTLFDVNRYNDLNNNPVINQSGTPYPAPQYLFLYLRGENWDVNATTASVSLEMWGWNVGGNGQWKHLSNIFPEGTITVKDSVPNYNWAKQCRFGCCDMNTKLPFILSWNAGWIFKMGITADNYLISWDGRFKLSLSTDANAINLNLYYSKKPCQNTTTDKASGAKVVYTTQTDGKSQYLYKLSIDPKLNRMFYANDLSLSMQYVPSNPNPILQSFGYSPIGEYAPPPASALLPGDKMNSPNDKISDCELKCSNATNPTCDNFYYYQDNTGKNYCTLGTKDSTGHILPKTGAINVPQPNSNIVNPSLYISDKNFNMDTGCMSQPIYVNNITTYEDANNYLKHTIKNEPLNSGVPLGYLAEKEYLGWYKTQQQLMFGTNYRCPEEAKCQSSVQQAFTLMNTQNDNENMNMNIVEPFNGYNTNSCTTDGAQVGCVNYIENNKIKPLLSANNQFLQTLSDLSNNNVHLSTSISQYKNIRLDLSNNVNAHYWDTTADHLINPVPTLLDTANSDTNTLMMQQNNMYIAGTMTTATLLILAIMLGSS